MRPRRGPLRRVHTAAPLKFRAGRSARSDARSTPPCSHGGSIEVARQCPNRKPGSTLRRVHTAAPLKCIDVGTERYVLCALRRVHTAAPLKFGARHVDERAILITPPCSHGGSIEVASVKLCTCASVSTPPCSHGGSIEVNYSQGDRARAGHTPPCSHGGSIEVVRGQSSTLTNNDHSAVFTRRLH